MTCTCWIDAGFENFPVAGFENFPGCASPVSSPSAGLFSIPEVSEVCSSLSEPRYQRRYHSVTTAHPVCLGVHCRLVEQKPNLGTALATSGDRTRGRAGSPAHAEGWARRRTTRGTRGAAQGRLLRRPCGRRRRGRLPRERHAGLPPRCSWSRPCSRSGGACLRATTAGDTARRHTACSATRRGMPGRHAPHRGGSCVSAGKSFPPARLGLPGQSACRAPKTCSRASAR